LINFCERRIGLYFQRQTEYLSSSSKSSNDWPNKSDERNQKGKKREDADEVGRILHVSLLPGQGKNGGKDIKKGTGGGGRVTQLTLRLGKGGNRGNEREKNA